MRRERKILSAPFDILCSKLEQIRFFLSDFSALTPSLSGLQIKRGAGAACRGGNVGLRQSRAEQRDAHGKPEAKFIAAAGPESWLV